jgi:hypothetical protein
MRIKRLFAGIAAVLTMALAAPALQAAAAPVKQADGTMFDAVYYAQNNPDVVACFGTDPNWMYLHYVLVGKAEGRLPYAPGALGGTGIDSTAFDATYYATRYPDVAVALGYDPTIMKLHYDLFGKAEGRFPNAAAEAAATGNYTAAAPVAAAPAAPAGVTISTLGSRYAAVEATLTLSGTGTGYHAKILLQSGASGSAVSFGIQYDAFARAPYTGRATYLCENVIHNGPGGQVYQWFGDAQLGVPTRIMMVLDTQTGVVDLYVNGAKVGSVGNTNLLAGNLSASVEGCARLDGDTVNAQINDIRFKKPGTVNTTGDSVYFWQCVTRNPGIAATYSGSNAGDWCTSSNVNINGMVIGLNGLDWDSAYANVSGVATYALWL